MEERMLDEEDDRLVKVKRTKEGVIEDVVDALAEEGEEEETEVYLDIPDVDEEYDEDLVGLTPEQLKREQERREQAAREAQEKHDSLMKEANGLLAEEKYEEALPFIMQALMYVPDSFEATCASWIARSENFTDTEIFYDDDIALEVAQSTDEVKAFVRERVGEVLRAQREELEAEAAPLRESVQAGQNHRRGAFAANQKYYLTRTLVFLACTLLFIVASGVSASYLVRTTSNLPMILMIAFGVVAIVFLVITLIFTRELLVANRLVRDNERLSSTEDGAYLAELEERLSCLHDVLDDEEEDEEDEEVEEE